MIHDQLQDEMYQDYFPVTNKGSHSWLFGSEAQKHIVAGAGLDDDHPASMSSYQTELGGIVAASYIMQRICDYYNITTGKATLYCGNKTCNRDHYERISRLVNTITKSFLSAHTWVIIWARYNSYKHLL
jgi:hypothetical protein